MIQTRPNNERRAIDWTVMIVPLLIIAALCGVLIAFPEGSRQVIDTVRAFVTDTFGWYYILLGLFFFLSGMYIAFSKRGQIRLGNLDWLNPRSRILYQGPNMENWGPETLDPGLAKHRMRRADNWRNG